MSTPAEDRAGEPRRRAIADAIIAAFPGMVEQEGPRERDLPWIELYVPGIEIVVYHQFLHLRLRWRTIAEMRELRLVEKLHQLAAVVEQVAGFDFFEHGCQALGERGDIDLVPDVIAGTCVKLRGAFGVTTAPT